MNDNSQINWPVCQKNLIQSERSDLPDNIRCLSVSKLDASALYNAVKLLGGSVTAVQIHSDEVPNELIGFSHEYISKNGRFSLELDPISLAQTIRMTTSSDITQAIGAEFKKRAENAQEERQRYLLEAWQSCIQRMVDSVAEVFPQSYKAFWLRANGRFDQIKKPTFHRHGAFPDMLGTNVPLGGYFLNFTPSYDGTVLHDKDNNLWYSPGGSYTLFTTDGHEYVDGCDHDVPDKFLSPIEGEKRATSVLPVYPLSGFDYS